MLAYSKDNEPMARVSKVARGMISLTHGVLFLLPDQRLYIVKCICVCVCVCVCMKLDIYHWGAGLAVIGRLTFW